MTSAETPAASKTPCEFCSELVSPKSMKRHVQRKHVVDAVPDPEVVPTVTGVFLANGETYTGRIVERTAQDFKTGSWDYYLIETSDGDRVIVQTERAA